MEPDRVANNDQAILQGPVFEKADEFHRRKLSSTDKP